MRTLTSETIGWVEGCLGRSASVAHAERLGGNTGPWLLRVRNHRDIAVVVLRDGDPAASNERHRFGVEAAALQAAEDMHIAAPRLIGHDLTGATTSRLAILSTHLPGDNLIPRKATHERFIELGRAAASLSRTPPNYTDLPVRSRPLADLDFASERAAGDTTEVLREADQFIASNPPPVVTSVLVHGDCWQGNTLWQDGHFTGFVDWDAAGVGQPGLDLANLRFDASLYYGLERLDLITQGWTDAGGPPISHMAYWDTVAALSSPTDLSAWTPTIIRPGRPDLDTRTLTARRNNFIKAALHERTP